MSQIPRDWLISGSFTVSPSVKLSVPRDGLNYSWRGRMIIPVKNIEGLNSLRKENYSDSVVTSGSNYKKLPTLQELKRKLFPRSGFYYESSSLPGRFLENKVKNKGSCFIYSNAKF